MTARMLYLHALTSLHTGTGQSVGVIDLPVAREKVYGWPNLPGSGLKGVLREACRASANQRALIAAFGPEAQQNAAPGANTQAMEDTAGALWFMDAHLLCFPVRSYFGSFAWITCPLALQRWQRDHINAGGQSPVTQLPSTPLEGEALVVEDDVAIQSQGAIYLEDLDLKRKTDPAIEALSLAIREAVFDEPAWQTRFRQRLAVVSDDTFTFLAETATEVVARIHLDNQTKTVQNRGLWYEEAVPAESIFSCPIIAAPETGRLAGSQPAANGSGRAIPERLLYPPEVLFDLVRDYGIKDVLQLGGNASVGRGLCRARLADVPGRRP